MGTPLVRALKTLWCGWLQKMVVSQSSPFTLLWQLREQRFFHLA